MGNTAELILWVILCISVGVSSITIIYLCKCILKKLSEKEQPQNEQTQDSMDALLEQLKNHAVQYKTMPYLSSMYHTFDEYVRTCNNYYLYRFRENFNEKFNNSLVGIIPYTKHSTIRKYTAFRESVWASTLKGIWDSIPEPFIIDDDED